MQSNQLVHVVLSILVSFQFLVDISGKMAPFLRQSIQTSKQLPIKPGSPTLMLKLPTRDPDQHRLKPRKKHLKTHKLMKRLSSEFDRKFMSVSQPSGNNEIVVHHQDDHLAREVHDLNVTLTDASGELIQLNATVAHALQTWLVNKGSCPVYYRWQDIGGFFWPRWIKHGYCEDEPSCSWPPGMHCIPAKQKRLKILRWHCRLWRNRRGRGRGRHNKNGGKKADDSNDTETWGKQLRGKIGKLSKRCKWVKIPYPITTKCYCSC